MILELFILLLSSLLLLRLFVPGTVRRAVLFNFDLHRIRRAAVQAVPVKITHIEPPRKIVPLQAAIFPELLQREMLLSIQCVQRQARAWYEEDDFLEMKRSTIVLQALARLNLIMVKQVEVLPVATCATSTTTTSTVPSLVFPVHIDESKLFISEQVATSPWSPFRLVVLQIQSLSRQVDATTSWYHFYISHLYKSARTRQEFCTEKQFSIEIQSMHRSLIKKQEYTSIQQSTKDLQSVWHMTKERRTMMEIIASASILQKQHRSNMDEKEYFTINNATTNLHSLYRIYTPRYAATTCQSLLRSKNEQDLLCTTRNTAQLLSSQYESNVYASDYFEIRKNNASLQALIFRNTTIDDFQECRASTDALQCFVRCSFEQMQFLMLKNNIISLQSLLRKHSINDNFANVKNLAPISRLSSESNSMQILQSKAKDMQCVFRSRSEQFMHLLYISHLYHSCKHQEELLLTKQVSQLCTSQLKRTDACEHFNRVRKSVKEMQSISMQSVETDCILHLRNASIALQSHYRSNEDEACMNLVRSAVSLMHSELSKMSIVKSQHELNILALIYRSTTAKREYQILQKNIQDIQNSARMGSECIHVFRVPPNLLRAKIAQNNFSQLKTSAESMQTLCRATAIRTDFESLRDAVSTLKFVEDMAFNVFIVRERIALLVDMQAISRTKNLSGEFCDTKMRSTDIQAQYRMHGLFEELNEMKSVVEDTQAILRMGSASTKDQFTAGACLQSMTRCILAKKDWKSLNEGVTAMQSELKRDIGLATLRIAHIYTSMVLNSDVNTTRKSVIELQSLYNSNMLRGKYVLGARSSQELRSTYECANAVCNFSDLRNCILDVQSIARTNNSMSTLAEIRQHTLNMQNFYRTSPIQFRALQLQALARATIAKSFHSDSVDAVRIVLAKLHTVNEIACFKELKNSVSGLQNFARISFDSGEITDIRQSMLSLQSLFQMKNCKAQYTIEYNAISSLQNLARSNSDFVTVRRETTVLDALYASKKVILDFVYLHSKIVEAQATLRTKESTPIFKLRVSPLYHCNIQSEQFKSMKTEIVQVQSLLRCSRDVRSFENTKIEALCLPTILRSKNDESLVMEQRKTHLSLQILLRMENEALRVQQLRSASIYCQNLHRRNHDACLIDAVRSSSISFQCALARKRAESEYTESLPHIIEAQAICRKNFVALDTIHVSNMQDAFEQIESFTSMKHNVIHLQALQRGQYQCFGDAKLVAKCLQSLERCMAEESRFEMLQKSLLLMQKLFKMENEGRAMQEVRRASVNCQQHQRRNSEVLFITTMRTAAQYLNGIHQCATEQQCLRFISNAAQILSSLTRRRRHVSEMNILRDAAIIVQSKILQSTEEQQVVQIRVSVVPLQALCITQQISNDFGKLRLASIDLQSMIRLLFAKENSLITLQLARTCTRSSKESDMITVTNTSYTSGTPDRIGFQSPMGLKSTPNRFRISPRYGTLFSPVLQRQFNIVLPPAVAPEETPEELLGQEKALFLLSPGRKKSPKKK